MAEKKVWAQRSCRVAIRRQSFSLPNAFSIGCRRLYSVLSKENTPFPVLRGDADCHPPGSRRFPQPTRVITSVCQKRTGIGNKALENGRTPVAADLPFSQQKRDRTPMPITNNMESGIQTSFCSSCKTWRISFSSRLAAVW